MDEREFDFWTDRLNISKGSYNSVVDEQIYGAAELVVEARAAGTSLYCNDLAESLGISKEHAELIQYILASVSMPVPPGKLQGSECFTYGTSPRGLFVDDMDMAKQFLMEFDQHMKRWADDEQ